jgi:hypothetical protein
VSEYAEADFGPCFEDVRQLGKTVNEGLTGINARPFLFAGREWPPGCMKAAKPVWIELPDGGFEVTYRFTFTPQVEDNGQ